MPAWIDALLPHGFVASRKQADYERAAGRFLLGQKDVDIEPMSRSMLTGPSEAQYKSSKDYRALAEHGYSRNVYLFRGTALIAEAAAGIDFTLYSTRGGGKKTRVDQHPILTLLNKRPNPREGGGEFKIALVSYWILAGHTYAAAVRGKGVGRGAQASKGPAAEIYALRPDSVRVILDKNTGVLTYEYKRQDGEKILYDAEDVMHTRRFSPLDEYVGVAPAMVAARAVDQHNAANDHNTALLQNLGRYPAMVTTDAQLTPDQRDTLKAQFEEKFLGPRNAGRPLFASGGLFKVERLMDTAVDMDWLGGKASAMREIAVALGVGSEMLNDAEGKTFANRSEARASMYTEVALPLLDILRYPLGNWLLPMFGMSIEDYEIDVDKDGIEALREEASAVWDRAANPNAPLTINERRELLGKDGIGEDGDVILVPSTLVPLEQVLEPPPPPPQLLPPDSGQDPQGNAGNGGNGPDGGAPSPEGDLPAPASGNKPTKEAERPPFGKRARRPAPRRTGKKRESGRSSE
jgi:HK97 family phage portal protein